MSEPANEQLASVENALAQITPDLADSHLGVEIMRDGLRRRRDQLLASLFGRFEVTLTREDAAVTGGELPLVGGVLTSLQESVASIAQAIGGERTSRGLIPASIKEAVELRLLAAQPGSLSLELIPVRKELQRPLFEDSEESLLEASVERFLALLSGRSDLLQDAADLGPRVTTHVAELSKHLAEAGATAAMTWQARRHRSNAIVDTERAMRLRQVLKEVDTETAEVALGGRLVGGNLVRRTFEIEQDDGHALAGSVDDAVLPDLKALRLGEEVMADLEVRTSRLASGETRESYVLVSLTPRQAGPGTLSEK